MSGCRVHLSILQLYEVSSSYLVKHLPCRQAAANHGVRGNASRKDPSFVAHALGMTDMALICMLYSRRFGVRAPSFG